MTQIPLDLECIPRQVIGVAVGARHIATHLFFLVTTTKSLHSQQERPENQERWAVWRPYYTFRTTTIALGWVLGSKTNYSLGETKHKAIAPHLWTSRSGNEYVAPRLASLRVRWFAANGTSSGSGPMGNSPGRAFAWGGKMMMMSRTA